MPPNPESRDFDWIPEEVLSFLANNDVLGLINYLVSTPPLPENDKRRLLAAALILKARSEAKLSPPSHPSHAHVESPRPQVARENYSEALDVLLNPNGQSLSDQIRSLKNRL